MNGCSLTLFSYCAYLSDKAGLALGWMAPDPTTVASWLYLFHMLMLTSLRGASAAFVLVELCLLFGSIGARLSVLLWLLR